MIWLNGALKGLSQCTLLDRAGNSALITGSELYAVNHCSWQFQIVGYKNITIYKLREKKKSNANDSEEKIQNRIFIIHIQSLYSSSVNRPIHTITPNDQTRASTLKPRIPGTRHGLPAVVLRDTFLLTVVIKSGHLGYRRLPVSLAFIF